MEAHRRQQTMEGLEMLDREDERRRKENEEVLRKQSEEVLRRKKMDAARAILVRCTFFGAADLRRICAFRGCADAVGRMAGCVEAVARCADPKEEGTGSQNEGG